MSDRIFLDTNILVYSYSNSEPLKQEIARKLISQNNSFISTQVLQELTNTVTKKFKFSYVDATNAVNENIQNNNLHINSANTIIQACKIASRYGFSFYDSLIISAAIESNCSILYSEDMKHTQVIFDFITIVNPFINES
jgi:predicted nucleic acid-binding protein